MGPQSSKPPPAIFSGAMSRALRCFSAGLTRLFSPRSWGLSVILAWAAAAAAANARMTDKLKERWEKSLVKLAEKHRIALDMAPEIIAGGCLLLWGSNLRKQAAAIKLKGDTLGSDPAWRTEQSVRALSENQKAA